MTAQDYTPWLFKSLNRKGLKLEDVSIPCVFAKGTSDFFNQDAVKTALHISDKATADYFARKTLSIHQVSDFFIYTKT